MGSKILGKSGTPAGTPEPTKSVGSGKGPQSKGSTVSVGKTPAPQGSLGYFNARPSAKAK